MQPNPQKSNGQNLRGILYAAAHAYRKAAASVTLNG